VAERWDVDTGDGGSIAVWVEGEGSPLVLVHGSVSDHTAFEPLVGELRAEFTTFAMDRRGFGASLDGPGYSAEREFGEGAVVEMFSTIVGLTEDEIEERRAAPNWPERVATAPTLAREARIEDGWDWQPDQFARIGVPTLLITGSETTTELAQITALTAAAIPGARVHVLVGHGHIAHRSEPAVVANVLRDWPK
jgi:pimeloyl-ACP methyl ester carboxylesterase